MFDDVASKSWAGWPERSRAESGPAASPETEALTISLPIELIDQVRQWASHNEIGLDELRRGLCWLLSTPDSRTPTLRRIGSAGASTLPTQSPRLSPSARAPPGLASSKKFRGLRFRTSRMCLRCATACLL